MKFTFLNQNRANKYYESRWFHSCVQQNIPYIVIRKKGSHADVEWDCITMNSDESEFAFTQKKFITHELDEFIKYYWVSKTVMSLGTLSGLVKNLPVETVEDFAMDICNTLSDAYKRHKLKHA